jgi:hypothetical protein
MRLGTTLVLILCCGIVIVGIFSPQISACYVAHHLGRSNALLNTVPQPLTRNDLAPSTGLTMRRFGIEFECPWKAVDLVNDYGAIGTIRFTSGQGLTVFGPSSQSGWAAIEETKGADGVSLGGIIGIDGSSGFEWVNSILRITPEQISIFMPRAAAKRSAMLLTLKSFVATGAETGLFTINTARLKGFQKGDPSRHPASIQVDLFDDQNREVQYWFRTKQGSGAEITQADINRILQTTSLLANDSK